MAAREDRVITVVYWRNMEPQNTPKQPEVITNQAPTVEELSVQTAIGTRLRALIQKSASTIKTKVKQKPLVLAAVGLLVLVGVLAMVYTTEERVVAVKQFTNVYSFVPEKISRSAAIVINVPEGVTEDMARANISFSPAVPGEWQTEELDKVIVFKPKKSLQSGVYYAVNLDTETVQMSGDFYVDEDPQIETIFPLALSEASEDSEITIVFNRPMVPLSTLTVQESRELPITIVPPTPGKFKWISSRNLQFIPETTLIPSSEYTVTIGEGLTSLDGLTIAPVTHTFFTRPLRYEYISENQIGYRSPIIIAFNQPVDLEKTARQISVTRQDGKNVSFEVQYGETTQYDREKRKNVTEPDPSKLFIYQREDQHGRNRLWDFDTTYTVAIGGAVPAVGTVELKEGRRASVFVPNIVAGVTAQSERTSLVRPDLFDPQGSLSVTFYDEIDTKKSTITVKGLKNIAYGEKCKTDEWGDPLWQGESCEKEVDTKTLRFTFDANAFSPNESFALTLDTIVTTDGFRTNAEPIIIGLKTYPQFQIAKTFPEGGATAAALDGMTVCSNAPLLDPEENGLGSYVETNGYIVFGRWSNSFYVEEKNEYNKCQTGEFETQLAYGLLPETEYSLQLKLQDVFGQSAANQLALKTKSPEAQYTRFHNMQQQYQVTPPDRTTFTYAVENLEYVDMHICKMSPETFLARVVEEDGQSTPARHDGCTAIISKQIPLPARYWVNNYFQVNLAEYFPDTRGHYILTFSHPLYIDESSQQRLYDRTYVSVTNLAVGKKEIENSEYRWSESNNPNKEALLEKSLRTANNLYWVNDSQALTPVAAAVVTQYASEEKRGFTRLTTGVTDGQGIARVPMHENLVGAIVTVGQDSAVVSDWADTLGYAGSVQDASKTYVYTDRPIYRPGQTVHIKGIDRIGFDGEYEIWKGERVPLEVFDAAGTRLYETKLEQSSYGTFATSVDLPIDAALGTYRIEVFGQSFYFDVEEYVPAAFKLEAQTDKEEYINGDTFTLDVQADYYFGVPLDGGTITYAVTAQDYYFDKYTDEYFNFGGDWYYCYSCGYGDDFLFRGETMLSERGHATIKQPFDFDEYFNDLDTTGSKLVTVSVTAKDANGRSVSLQKSFVVHKGEFYLGAKTDEYYTSLATPNTLRIKTVDTAGKPFPVSGIERILYKVDWETFKRQEVDGGFYYRSEKKLTEVSREKIKTDNKGNWSGQFTVPSEGQYEIQVLATDDRGTKLQTTTTVYVYGSAAVTVPPNNNYELDLEVEKTVVAVGDTASVLIKSPYPRAKALVSVERGTVYDYWIVDVVGGLYVHEFPIKSTYAPNMYVSVLLLSPDPEVKYGTSYFTIGAEEKALAVSVTANKTHYLPGEAVTLTVKTTNHSGEPTPAEVSIAVADLSVLALKGNPKKNPLVFFYNDFPLAVSTASNIKNILYEVDIPLGTKGGGGASPEDLAKKKRGTFKDTAFWEAFVVTDDAGEATVTFTLPDNLTTWQVETLGVTLDTKLGVGYHEFTTKKDLMAVPLKPRFVVPGDQFSLGATVFNQTSKGSTIDVSLESTTLSFTGKTTDSVFVNAGESKTVYFAAVAPKERRAGEHVFTFTAANEEFEDRVEQSITITPNTTYETVATAQATKDDVSLEYLYVPDTVVAGEGGLTINANATMAVFMTDALSYMVTYPYGCSEQLASALSTIGVLTDALTLPNVAGEFSTIDYDGVTYTVDTVVADGLARIYETQTLGGGFAYYKGLEANLPLTIHVVSALYDLQVAGYEIKAAVLAEAARYIEQETTRLYTEFPEQQQETVIMAAYVLKKVSPDTKTALADMVKTLIKDDAFLQEKISSMALAYLAILTTSDYSAWEKNRVYVVLQNRLAIDGRGAYLTAAAYENRDYYETSIKNTALALAAMVAHEDEHEMLPNLLRWLLASKDTRGAWGSTHNTFMVVRAMVGYLKWQHESEAHFTLRGLLDGVEIFGHEFSPQNVFETFTHFIAMEALPKAQLVPLRLEKEDKNEKENNLYYDLTLKYYLPVEALPPRDEGITITRDLFALTDTRNEKRLDEVSVGEVVRGKLVVAIPDVYHQVAIEDYIPAGFEIVNFNLSTEDQSLQSVEEEELYDEWHVFRETSFVANVFDSVRNIFGDSQSAQVYSSFTSKKPTPGKMKLRPTHTESHDDRVFLYLEQLEPGVYEYEYYLRALVPGTFQRLPARAEELYFPEVFGRTSGEMVTVTAE
jgi:uncharacterized protein YfaS (alpha-2-macroglobulin family)